MTEVSHNPAEGRYELSTEHGLATAAYARDGGTLVFTHTNVPRADEGHGVGSALVAGAMADVRRAGLKVVPQCPFVANWFAHHPDERDLLAGAPDRYSAASASSRSAACRAHSSA